MVKVNIRKGRKNDNQIESKEDIRKKKRKEKGNINRIS